MVKTSSGATAVQIVCSSRRGSREIKHLGSRTATLSGVAEGGCAAAAGGPQGELDLGLGPAAGAGAGRRDSVARSTNAVLTGGARRCAERRGGFGAAVPVGLGADLGVGLSGEVSGPFRARQVAPGDRACA